MVCDGLLVGMVKGRMVGCVLSEIQARPECEGRAWLFAFGAKACMYQYFDTVRRGVFKGGAQENGSYWARKR